MTQTILAHFDGKVIVPDAPVELATGQALKVSIELVGKREMADEPEAADESEPPFAFLERFTMDLPGAPRDLSVRRGRWIEGS